MAEWLMALQIQISIAVVIILLLRQAMKKMPKVYSYLLWLLVFARLLVPVSVESRFSFMPSQQEREALVEQVLESIAGADERKETLVGVQENTGLNADVEMNSPLEDLGNGTEIQPNYGGVPGTTGNTVVQGAEELSGAGEDMPEQFLGELPVASGRAHSAKKLLDAAFLMLWATGLAAVLCYNGVALRKVRRKLSSTQYLLDSIRVGAKSVPVYASAGIHTPFTLGFLKPVIYLPAGLAEREQEYILCHERVHISRKDNLVKNLVFLLTAIYWFNPFVWVAFFFMERDMEMSCDEKVIQLMGKDIKRNYSQSLLNFAEGRGKMPATHLTFGENSVKQRVKNVLSYKNAKKWSIVAGAVVLVVVVVALFTTGRDEEVADSGDQVQVDNQGSLASGEDSKGGSQAQDGAQQDDLILTKEQFESFYGQAGNYDFEVLGYGDSFYRSIMQQLFYGTDAATKEYYERFTDPVTAAVELLHLGEGIGVVASHLSVIYVSEEEGNEVTVVYTFAKDSSVVGIPMVLIEDTFGIWAPKGTAVREVERSEQIWSRVSEDGTMGWDAWIQVTQYGIYRELNGQLTCLYPCYVNPKNDFHVYEEILYFVADSDYEEGDEEYQEDAIAMLDLNTLQVDRDAIPLNINRTTEPISLMYGGNGILEFRCRNEYYHLPMVNTGDVKFSTMNTFNNKAVMELTESEQDAYGVAVRNELLENPGVVLELSNRTLEENFALIDMDGDGRTERISLSPDPNATRQLWGSEYDNYQFKIGESVVTGGATYLYNQIFAFSIDGEEIVLAIQEDGPSGDPQAYLFLYRNGQVKPAGTFAEYITYADMEDGIIHVTERVHVIQTEGIRYQYRINADGELERIEQGTYDFTGLNDIKLLVELPVHAAPGSEDVTYMQPQTVHFLKTDRTLEWVYVEGEDGTGGWFHVGTTGSISELGMDSVEVFEGLSFAG